MAKPLALVITALITISVEGQRFSLRGQSYPNHGLVLIDEIGETDTNGLDPNDGLHCVSDLTDCCTSGNRSLRGEFDFPDESVVPIEGNILNGYYRNRAADRIFLNRRSGTAQGLFQCRIRTQDSPSSLQKFYIGVYDENSGIPTVSSVSTNGLNLTCTSTGGPATSVIWRKSCAVLPNNAMYQQTQTVIQIQTATYQNTLVIDSAVTDHDGVYTCSVTNARGYSNGATGMGASYEASLPFTVTIMPTSSPVAGESFTLTCGSTATTPTYRWFNEAGTMIGTQATLTLNPLLESHSGEYSCLVTDQAGGLVGCGVERVTVEAPSVTVTVEGVDGVTAGISQTLTCTVSGVDLQAAAVTSVMYTWLCDGSEVQAASTSNQYTIPSVSLSVDNAGDVYICQVAIAASYWDVSGSFGGSGSGVLTVIIPTPMIQFSRVPLLINYYVGLFNFIWRCDVNIPGAQLIGVNAVVEWTGPSGNLASSNDGRLTLEPLVVDSPGREYRRLVTFSPLSADDMGSYSCLATIMPTTANPKVTNSVGIGNNNLTVTTPTLDVSIDRTGVHARIINAPSFNGFTLICMATSKVAGWATVIRKHITWTRSVNGGASVQLTNGTNIENGRVMVMEDDLLQATSMSVLMVNTTMSGSHSYTCRAELVVAPAPDDINAQNQTTVTIVGPSPPVEPMGLMAVDITHNSATIRWTVSFLSYDPEIYVVQYGLAMDSLTMTSSIVMGDVTPLNYMDSYQGSVTLIGLDRSTTYFYRVRGTNGAGSTLSVVETFNTSDLAPEPPTMLQCSQLPNDPLSYTCNWMAPTVTNGVLAGYELTCQPRLEGIPSPPVLTPSMTSATVSSLRNGVNYTCTVRARNQGGLSLASVPTSFYTTEIAPTGAPLEVMFSAVSDSRDILFIWLPPAPTMRNGLITGYTLNCSITETGMGQISSIYPPQESYRLSGFRPTTDYTCRVVAMNSAGSGPPAEITLTSPEDAPGGPPQNIQFELRDPGVVIFSWSPPLEELRNGVIQSYLISCIDLGREREPITRTVYIREEFSRMETVSGFTPATRYNCSLAARTSVGVGVNGTVIVLTTPDQPIILQVTTEARSLLAIWTYSNPSLADAVIHGYHVYINDRLNRATTATQLNVTGLTPFTNYTVEVSAFNTRSDGTEQEGPRSEPTTEATLEVVPGPPVCPQRWTTKSLSSLTIDWQPPTQPNGVITGYFLKLVSYDNQSVLQSGSESGRLTHNFTGFTIAAGVPHHVRVYAENTIGRGSYCITTDFGDQLTPPSNILNNLTSSYNSTDSSSVLLSWTVLPLDQAKGFITLSITFGPLATANEARQKRQTATECSQSPCQVPYEQGRVSIIGLDSQQSYFINVVPQNEEGETGTPIAVGIPASIKQLSPITCTVATNNSTAVIAGGSAVIVVLALLLFVAVVVIAILLMQLRKHKHPLSYELPVATFSSKSKADIITTQCEAYEVLKLQEMPQEHAHTDVRQEEAYEVVGEGLVTDMPSPQAAGRPRPQQETTTQEMYEEVAHH